MGMSSHKPAGRVGTFVHCIVLVYHRSQQHEDAHAAQPAAHIAKLSVVSKILLMLSALGAPRRRQRWRPSGKDAHRCSIIYDNGASIALLAAWLMQCGVRGACQGVI